MTRSTPYLGSTGYICVYFFFPTFLCIWLCLFLAGWDFSKCKMFELGKSYPRIIPRKTRRWTFLLGLFRIAVASAVWMDLTSKLTSVGQIRWSLATFTYLHDSKSSPRARSLIPKLAGSGWLAGWLAGWLRLVAAGWLRGWLRSQGSCCCWLGGWLRLGCCLGRLLMRMMALAVAGWLADWLAGWLAAKPKVRRRGTLEA